MPTPGTAGYSGTPLVKKLGLKEASRVLLLGAPDDFTDLLGPLPVGVTFERNAGPRVHTIPELALPLGFVDVKVCAVSAVWSGLKLVVRKELR